MKTISVFNYMSVDGFFAGQHAEIDWFKLVKKDDAYEKYIRKQSKSDSTLIFGHTTYEMMKSYWPSPEAIKNDPDMAKVLNYSPKIVYSRTLKSAEEGLNWKNVRLFHEIEAEEILKLKEKKDLTILGSGTIVQQFSNLALIDNYVFVIVPVILGAGKPMFKDVRRTNLKLIEAKAFNNGVTLLHYQQAKN